MKEITSLKALVHIYDKNRHKVDKWTASSKLPHVIFFNIGNWNYGYFPAVLRSVTCMKFLHGIDQFYSF